MIDQGALLPGAVPAEVNLAGQIDEVKRELALRHKVYRHWVAMKKMTQADAERHMLAMQAVLETLLRVESVLPELGRVDQLNRGQEPPA